MTITKNMITSIPLLGPRLAEPYKTTACAELPPSSRRGFRCLSSVTWRRFIPISKGLLVAALMVVLSGCQLKQAPVGPSITVAAILPITGTASELAEQHKRGILLGVESLRGQKDITLDTVIEDDKNDPRTTIDAVHKVLSINHANAVLTVMSGPSMAIAPVLQTQSVPLIANCGHPDITRIHTNVVRNFPSSYLEVKRMLQFAKDKLSLHSMWFLYIDDAYGQGARDALTTEAQIARISVLGSDAYGKSGSDLRPALTRVNAASPNGIYVYGYGKATADAVNQIRAVGYTGILLGNYNFSQPPLTTVSSDAIRGAYYTTPKLIETANEHSREFFRRYRAQFNSDPLWNAAIEYDAILIIKEAALRAQASNITLLDSIRTVGDFTGALGTYTFDPNRREWLTPLAIAHVTTGTVEVIE